MTAQEGSLLFIICMADNYVHLSLTGSGRGGGSAGTGIYSAAAAAAASLSVPDPGAAEAPPPFILHTLLPSDTLDKLSLKYRVSKNAILQLNDLPSSGNLFSLASKTIKIPTGRLPPKEEAKKESQAAMLRRFRVSNSLLEQEAKYYLEEAGWDYDKAQRELQRDLAFEAANASSASAAAAAAGVPSPASSASHSSAAAATGAAASARPSRQDVADSLGLLSWNPFSSPSKPPQLDLPSKHSAAMHVTASAPPVGAGMRGSGRGSLSHDPAEGDEEGDSLLAQPSVPAGGAGGGAGGGDFSRPVRVTGINIERGEGAAAGGGASGGSAAAGSGELRRRGAGHG